MEISTNKVRIWKSQQTKYKCKDPKKQSKNVKTPTNSIKKIVIMLIVRSSINTDELLVQWKYALFVKTNNKSFIIN